MTRLKRRFLILAGYFKYELEHKLGKTRLDVLEKLGNKGSLAFYMGNGVAHYHSDPSKPPILIVTLATVKIMLGWKYLMPGTTEQTVTISPLGIAARHLAHRTDAAEELERRRAKAVKKEQRMQRKNEPTRAEYLELMRWERSGRSAAMDLAANRAKVARLAAEERNAKQRAYRARIAAGEPAAHSKLTPDERKAQLQAQREARRAEVDAFFDQKAKEKAGS